MKPLRSILDRAFVYTPSHETDLRKRFAKIRREQRAEAERERQQKVVTLTKGVK
jgi:hypothetical protein